MQSVHGGQPATYSGASVPNTLQYQFWKGIDTLSGVPGGRCNWSGAATSIPQRQYGSAARATNAPYGFVPAIIGMA